jgi:uncharacterized protein YndB with AHSA1/START domain
MTDTKAEIVDGGPQAVAAARVIRASAETIFDLLADPAAHHRFDGSGMVQGHRLSAPDRLSLGASFGMNMKLGPIPYRMSNEVVEFEDNKRIAWRHLGHHIWRYVLEPADGGTRVTESFDWSAARAPFIYGPFGYIERNQQAVVATLDRLAELVERDPGTADGT